MVLAEAVLVLGLFAVLVFTALMLLMRPGDQQPSASLPGEWRVAHYDTSGVTKVVVQKVARTGGAVLDEHLVAALPVGDPEYDAAFLAAMSTARERRALFESEED